MAHPNVSQVRCVESSRHTVYAVIECRCVSKTRRTVHHVSAESGESRRAEGPPAERGFPINWLSETSSFCNRHDVLALSATVTAWRGPVCTTATATARPPQAVAVAPRKQAASFRTASKNHHRGDLFLHSRDHQLTTALRYANRSSADSSRVVAFALLAHAFAFEESAKFKNIHRLRIPQLPDSLHILSLKKLPYSTGESCWLCFGIRVSSRCRTHAPVSFLEVS